MGVRNVRVGFEFEFELNFELDFELDFELNFELEFSNYSPVIIEVKLFWYESHVVWWQYFNDF